LGANAKPHTRACYDCGNYLELYEIDMEKGTRILRCPVCGLFHFYKKDFFGGWKTLKVTKDPSRVESPE